MISRQLGATIPPAAAIGRETPVCSFLPAQLIPAEAEDRHLLHKRQLFALFGTIVAVAFSARLLMAILLKSPCNDSYFYFCIANLLSNHQYDRAFIHLNLNTYPAILAVLNSWGIDWIVAGKYWSVAVSTLTILPLFGFVRRVWGDRVGLAAALLYAIHPEMIEIGVEPIREPTFWLFLACSLYAMTRAFQETSLPFFCLAGLATCLAMFTRTEGLVLLLVLAIGAAVALFNHQTLKQRLRISLGVLVCLCMTPLLLVAVNVYLLPDHPQWEFGRLSHLEYLASVAFPSNAESTDDSTAAQSETATSTVKGSPSDAARDDMAEQRNPDITAKTTNPNEPLVEPSAVASTVAVPPDKRLFARVVKFLTELNDVYGPHNLLFFALGIGLFWKRRLLWNLIPSFIPMMAVMAAVWLRLAAESGGINGRYFLTMYFFVVPVLGIGLLSALQIVANHEWNWLPGRPGGQRAASIAAGILAVILVADAITSRHRSREADLEIAARLVERYGPINHVISDYQTTRVGFEIRRDMPDMLAFVPLVATADRPGNNVVLVSTKCTDPLYLQDLNEWMTHLGYESSDAEYWRERRKDLIVYRRKRKLAAASLATHH